MPELLDIVGQDEASAGLQRALDSGRIPHAWLFAGSAGVGRRTTAVALARTLLCGQVASRPNNGRIAALPDDFKLRQACGRCEDCAMTAAGSHPDLHLVYKELARYHDDPAVRDRLMQDLSIGVVRSFLISPAYLAAARGRGKVFIVIESDLMSIAAQNSLLKTLEEPPQGVRIILICGLPEQMLPTTRSRCATVRFNMLPKGFVTASLVERGLPADEAAFWAALTDGSLGRSIRLAEEGMFKVKAEVVGA